jgi:hypothetical protein
MAAHTARPSQDPHLRVPAPPRKRDRSSFFSYLRASPAARAACRSGKLSICTLLSRTTAVVTRWLREPHPAEIWRSRLSDHDDPYRDLSSNSGASRGRIQGADASTEFYSNARAWSVWHGEEPTPPQPLTPFWRISSAADRVAVRRHVQNTVSIK